MDLVDVVYLSNVLNPRYRTIYLRANMARADCDKILQMCKDEVIMIDQIRMKDTVKNSEHNTDQNAVSASNMTSAFEKKSDLPEFDRLTRNMLHNPRMNQFRRIGGLYEYREIHQFSKQSINSANKLRYWKRQRKLFPRLASVARVAYRFSFTSTSCERSFSLARNVIGHTRHRLDPLTLERMISLKALTLR